MMVALIVANLLGAVVSGVSCLVGLVRPALALPPGESVTSGVMFFAGAYAARALPLSLVTLALFASGVTTGLVPVLVISGLAQVGDAVLGARQRNYPMVACCLALALINLASAAWLLHR